MFGIPETTSFKLTARDLRTIWDGRDADDERKVIPWPDRLRRRPAWGPPTAA